MIDRVDALNEAGRMQMIQGYRETPHVSPDSQYFAKAEELFKNAYNLKPDNGHYALNVADALFALGKKDEAMKYYHEAVSKLSEDSDHLAGVRRRWELENSV